MSNRKIQKNSDFKVGAPPVVGFGSPGCAIPTDLPIIEDNPEPIE